MDGSVASMTVGHKSPWPERDDELRQHWAEGTSTAEIGRRMNLSKNAIVGRAHRLDLLSLPSPIRDRDGNPVPRRGPTQGAGALAAAQARSASHAKRKPPTLADLLPASETAPEPEPPTVSELEKVPIAPPPLPIVTPQIVLASPPGPVSAARRCQFPLWPLNAKAPSPPLYCGAPALPERSWCERHDWICHTETDLARAAARADRKKATE